MRLLKNHITLLSWSDERCVDCGRFIGTNAHKKRCVSCYKKENLRNAEEWDKSHRSRYNKNWRSFYSTNRQKRLEKSKKEYEVKKNEQAKSD